MQTHSSYSVPMGLGPGYEVLTDKGWFKKPVAHYKWN